jgi:predicted MFS family arabinose efflux permease
VCVSVGDVLINRISPTLTHTASGHDKSILLLGIGAAIAAIVIGLLARRAASLGVAGLAALALVGAFVAVTRPDSHVTDVFPSVFGGLAGVLALLWLVNASAPVTPDWPTRGSGRRRAR